jgi:rare lipoprotein A
VHSLMIYGAPRPERRRRRVRVFWPLVLALTCACSSTARPPPVAPHHEGAANVQRGFATWYGEAQMTASGERYDKHAMTAAHRSLPFGTRVRVTNQKNGRSVEVRINDRGPFGHADRIIDLSETAARELHMIDDGVVPVELEVLR